VLRIDVGSGNRHAGIEVADHELDTVADKLVGDRHALLRIGSVVAEVDVDLLPLNASRLVDVRGRLPDALDQLRSEGRAGPGDRRADADFYLRLRCSGEPQRQSDGH
jgi:hypothetical protein